MLDVSALPCVTAWLRGQHQGAQVPRLPVMSRRRSPVLGMSEPVLQRLTGQRDNNPFAF